MAENLDMMQRQIKDNIIQMIENGKLQEAKVLLSSYSQMVENDLEAFSIESVIAIQEGRFDDARSTLMRGLAIDRTHFDLQYNLSYVYELQKEYTKAANIYLQLSDEQYTVEQREVARQSYEQLCIHYPELISEKTKQKIVFFVKHGLDSFLNHIISELSNEYETKKIIVTNSGQIDEAMKWADICWFEWCDELILYGSHLELAKNKKIICRLHSYEAFTDWPQQVNWLTVDKVIFVAKHIRDLVLEKAKGLTIKQTFIVPNGIDLTKYHFREGRTGFKISYVGYINYKKGPMLLLHAFKAIYDYDNRYKLYIAGTFQDDRDVLYFRQMIQELGLSNNVIYDGWQESVDQWLEDKDYLISTSVLEGHPVCIMEAMAKGIKPLVHNFVGARGIYKDTYVWNTIDEAVKMVSSSQYSSAEYRKFIETNYSLEKQVTTIKDILQSLKSEEVNQRNEVKEYYDNFLSYLKQDRERENPRHVYLKNRLQQIIKPGNRVLDLGCGIGLTSEYMQQLGASVLGVDLSDSLIEYAKQTVKSVDFMVHDITTFSIDQTFDAVVLCDCMEHIPRERYCDLFQVIRKHVKEDGIVYISIPDPEYMCLVREKRPDLLQIIDNSIYYAEIETLCKQAGLHVSFYNTYSVFVGNEYNEYTLQTTEYFQQSWKSIQSQGVTAKEEVAKGEKLQAADDEVKQYYDNFLSYLKQDRERENPRHVYLKNRLQQIIKPGNRVLDLGCGIGLTSEYMHQLGASVLGVDLSDSLIEYAKQTVKGVDFIVHDITAFSIDETFDAVVLCDCMEHIPRERYCDLFQVIRKHVKEDGVVYISIPDPEYMTVIREKRPDLLQIIDNSIYHAEIQTLCEQANLHVSFYNAYSIFVGNEYNEYVLRTNEEYVKKWNVLNNSCK